MWHIVLWHRCRKKRRTFRFDYAPTIVAESSVALRTLSVASAVVELDLIENPVLVFRNAGNDEVNIVYRRADGNIGWVDPSTVTRQAAPRA